jgi:hypothetical protein
LGVKQIWVFDHDQDPNGEFHNPAKLDEILRRKKKRDEAAQELLRLQDFKQEVPLFSDDENESQPEEQPEEQAEDEEIDLDAIDEKVKTKTKTTNKTVDKTTEDRILTLEKRTFRPDKEMLNDIKLMLNCLNITYIEAPAGFEGEAIGSYLTTINKADAVYSGDTDPIAFGAKILYRTARDKKVYEYTQENVLAQIADKSSIEEPTIQEIRKAGVILGTDLAEKTPGIGPATVLKKLHTVKLTAKQKVAMQEFEKIPEEGQLEFHNEDAVPFSDKEQIEKLITWLVDVKAFNRSRIQKQFDKAASQDTGQDDAEEAEDKPKCARKKSTKVPTKKPPLPPKRVHGKAMQLKLAPTEEDVVPEEAPEEEPNVPKKEPPKKSTKKPAKKVTKKLAKVSTKVSVKKESVPKKPTKKVQMIPKKPTKKSTKSDSDDSDRSTPPDPEESE